jgi:hypothetical protein
MTRRQIEKKVDRVLTWTSGLQDNMHHDVKSMKSPRKPTRGPTEASEGGFSSAYQALISRSTVVLSRSGDLRINAKAMPA